MFDARALWIAVTATILSGCGTSDKVVGRFHSVRCETVAMPLVEGSPPVPAGFALAATEAGSCADVIPTASASAVSLPVPEGGMSKTGTDLPERAMASYITALARLNGSTAALRSALGAPLGEAAKPSGIQDRTSFRRTIIVSVRMDGGFNPADRLEQTDVLIRLHRARFVSWDLLATDYQTIDAGKIGLVTTNGSSQGLTVGTPAGAPVTASASLGASQSSARTENLDAAMKVPNLSATVDGDGNLRIYRRGGYGIDLSGNSIIRAEIRYTGEPGPGDPVPRNPNYTELWDIGPYADAAGRQLAPARVKAVATPFIEAPPGSAIKADVFLNYTLRHVISGGSTYEERDDDVLSRTLGPIHRQVTLVPGRDVDTPGYTVAVDSGPHRGVLNIQRRGLVAANLCFASYAEAVDFLRYMRTVAGGPPSGFGDIVVGPADGATPGVPGIARLNRADLAVAIPRRGCT